MKNVNRFEVKEVAITFILPFSRNLKTINLRNSSRLHTSSLFENIRMKIVIILLLLNYCCFAQGNSQMNLRNADIYGYKYLDSSLFFNQHLYINENYKIKINYNQVIVFHDRISDTINNVSILRRRKISIIGNWVIGSLNDDSVIAMNFIDKRIIKFYSFRHSLDGANDSACFVVDYSRFNDRFLYKTLSLKNNTLVLSNSIYVYPRGIDEDTALIVGYFSDKYKFFNFACFINNRNRYYYHEIWKCDSLILRLDNGDDDIYSNYTDIYYDPDSCFIYIQKHGQHLSGVVSGSHSVFFFHTRYVIIPDCR